MTQETINLTADRRELTKKPAILRKEGIVPAILYGQGLQPIPLAVNKGLLDKVYQTAGKNTIVELRVGDQNYKTIIHDIQYHPVSDEILHADFYQISLKDKIKTEIPLVTIGESKAVEEIDGSLIMNKSQLAVEALPQDLVHEITVDISSLATFEDVIHIKDLKIPAGIEVLDNPEEVVALIQPPRSEEELAELEEKVEEDVEQVEVEEKGKAEEESGEPTEEPIKETPTAEPKE